MEQKQEKIFGLRAIIEAINAGREIAKIYLQKDVKNPLFYELSGLIKENNIATSNVPIEKLNRLSKNGNHQGAVATISPINYYDLETLIETVNQKKTAALFLLLDQITDVRNFGAIIRTAECTGVDGIIIPQHGSAPLNGDAIKTSAGAAFKIPICKVAHIKDAVFMLQASNIQIVAATEKTTESLYSVDFCKPTAIVMGSEHKGVSNSILKLANHKAKLPLLGEIASLNVSVACGAFLYETVRQRL